MAQHIDYYVSLNSPWTHFGAARIEAMAQANNATLRIYPVDFFAIFPQSGGLPLPKRRLSRVRKLSATRVWSPVLLDMATTSRSTNSNLPS